MSTEVERRQRGELLEILYSLSTFVSDETFLKSDAVTTLLDYITDALDELDLDDTFGTEGWRRFIKENNQLKSILEYWK